MCQVLAIPSVLLGPSQNPDKRISHTSGSSVNPSDRLYSTTWIQVFATNRTGPFVQFQYLLKPLPCTAWPLNLAVDPFKQDLGCVVNVATTFIRVIRHGVIVQIHDTYNSGIHKMIDEINDWNISSLGGWANLSAGTKKRY